MAPQFGPHWSRRKLFAFCVALFLAAGTSVAAAIPGAHRALCPSCFDLVQIDDNIYVDTDDEARHSELLAMLRQSESNVQTYLGSYRSNPRIIMCTSDDGACNRLFGTTGPRGVAWGASLIRLNPKGLNETIATHELVHIELARRMGQIGMWRDVVPRWFNEGLAVYVSKDDRFTYDYSESERLWARGIESLDDWRLEVNADTWPTAYGASAHIVRDIENQIGRDGIIDLIERVTEGGEEFEEALAALIKEKSG